MTKEQQFMQEFEQSRINRAWLSLGYEQNGLTFTKGYYDITFTLDLTVFVSSYDDVELTKEEVSLISDTLEYMQFLSRKLGI